MLTPVTLALGRLRLETRPLLTGAAPLVNTTGIFVVAALLTPGPDPVSQLLLALPLCVLYLLSIGVAAWAAPREAEA